MARNLNGTSAYLYSATQSSTITSTATLSMWLKRDVATPSSITRTGFCALGVDQASENSHYPYTNGLGYLAVFRDGGSRVNTINLGSADRAKWHHVAITSQPGVNGWKFYINGQVLRQETGHSTISFRTGDWRFGRSGNTGQYYFEGDMADVAVWNVALTSAEIGCLANGRVASTLTNRISNVVIYQDLIRPLNRPGLGAVVSSSGTSVVDHSPMLLLPGMQRFATSSFGWLGLLQATAKQLNRAGAASGQSNIAGADVGATIYAGEVAS